MLLRQTITYADVLEATSYIVSYTMTASPSLDISLPLAPPPGIRLISLSGQALT